MSAGWLDRRLLLTLAMAWVVATIVFLALHMVPGDPAELLLSTAGTVPDPASVAELRERLGLDQPLLAQYGHFLAGLARVDHDTPFGILEGQARPHDGGSQREAGQAERACRHQHGGPLGQGRCRAGSDARDRAGGQAVRPEILTGRRGEGHQQPDRERPGRCRCRGPAQSRRPTSTLPSVKTQMTQSDAPVPAIRNRRPPAIPGAFVGIRYRLGKVERRLTPLRRRRSISVCDAGFHENALVAARASR